MKDTTIKLTPELLKRAKQVFAKISTDVVWINKKHEFFTSENLALNSVTGERKDTKRITRDQVVTPSKTKAPEKLIITTADNEKIAFVDRAFDEIPQEGDKAKNGKKNAHGIFKIDPETSMEFEKGVFKKTIVTPQKDQ